MRKVDFEQGSQAWLDWRKGLLTATDAAMLLGVSPYVTPYKGWQRKLGDIPEQTVNPAMLRGQRDEPIARAMFIEQSGINMTPCCVESDIYKFIGASLDGISDCGKYILEIKSQRPVSAIPDFHNMQMQHQFLSTDNEAKKGFYVSIWENKIYPIEVDLDLEWQKNYLPQAKEFWKKVALREAPALMDKDYKDMTMSTGWSSYANEYIKLCFQIKHLETIKDSYKTELIALCEDENCSGGGIKVLKRKMKGRVDYDELLKEIGIEEEKVNRYRKPDSTSWAIMVDGKK